MKKLLLVFALLCTPVAMVSAQDPVPMVSAASTSFVDSYYVASRYATAPTSTYAVPMAGNFSYWGYGPHWSYYPYWNYSPYYTVATYYGTGGYGFGYYAPYYTAYYPWSNPYYFYAYPWGSYYPYYGAFPSDYYAWAYPYYPGSYFYYNYSPIYTYGFGMYGSTSRSPRDIIANLNAAPISSEGIVIAANAVKSESLIATVSFAKEPPTEEIDTKAAETFYAIGCELFWQSEHAAAIDQFAKATASDPNDARYWYFRGISETMTGSPTAENSLGRAIELESQHGRSPEVAQALERIQGAFRLKLEEALRQARLQSR